MRCKKTISCLNAYVDGELVGERRNVVEAHLAACESCRERLEEIQGLAELFEGRLPVPPVPEGFAASVMAEARRKLPVDTSESPSPLPAWNPLEWFIGLSTPIKLGVCASVLLALVVGLSLGGRNGTSGSMLIEKSKDLYGLEWFAPAPPGSIGSIYIAMANHSSETGDDK